MDGPAHALIGAAAADVSDVGVDVGIGRRRMVLEECRHRHDLPGLAIAALRHVLGDPCLLHRMLAIGRQPLDASDASAVDARDRHRAGPHRLPVDVNRAGAALRDAAAVLRSGEAHDIAQGPKERWIGFDIELVLRAVDCDRDHRQALLTSMAAKQIVAPKPGPSNGLMVPGEKTAAQVFQGVDADVSVRNTSEITAVSYNFTLLGSIVLLGHPENA